MWLLKSALQRHCGAAAVLLVLVLATPAHADDLDTFNTAVETAMNHRRAAAGYLRTGNRDLAAAEIEGMRQAWAKVSTLPRPAAFPDQKRYTETMLDIATRLIGTTLVLNLGRADIARESLDAVRKSLSQLRRENHVTVLADCVLDANVAMEALFALDGGADWESVVAGAESYAATLKRCDGMAGKVRDAPEFHRPIDGALASLGQIPKAADTRDSDLLHRLLIELRALDNLLAFRYG